MNSYTKKFWGEVRNRIGSLADMAPMIARQIKISLDQEDATAVQARANELDELADSLKVLAAEMRAATADGFIDLEEGASLLVAAETVIDQGEDVVTGRDEDDETGGQPQG